MNHSKTWLRDRKIPYWMYHWFRNISAIDDPSKKSEMSKADWSYIQSCWKQQKLRTGHTLTTYQMEIVDKIYSRYQRRDVRNANW